MSPARLFATTCLALACALAGCRKDAAGKVRDAHATSGGVLPRVAQPSDSVLSAHLERYRDWALLVNRHKAELDRESSRLQAAYGLAGAGKIQHDAKLLTVINRQREEMRAFEAGLPSGAGAEALTHTIAGIGNMVLDANGLTWVTRRNDSTLVVARAKYGGDFVDWVLSRQGQIVSTLGVVHPPQ